MHVPELPWIVWVLLVAAAWFVFGTLVQLATWSARRRISEHESRLEKLEQRLSRDR